MSIEAIPARSEDGFGSLIRQFRAFLTALWSSPGRVSLNLLTVGIVSVICATAVGQIFLNAWNKPFYDAIAQRDFAGFLYQLMIFGLIVTVLLALNVAQAWLREMIKLRSREWLTRDLFAQWLKPGRAMHLAYAGEIGVNPDQRIHEDARRVAELSADLGIGLFQASLLLVSFIGVLWSLSGGLTMSLHGYSFTIPGYMVWCALLYAATGSWLTWLVGRPLVGINATRLAREADLRFALVQANEHTESIALEHGEAREQQRLIADLDQVLVLMRKAVYAHAQLAWVTSGYGWIAIVAPIVIAAPSYFGGKLSFGDLMVIVGAFYQVNQSLRWFVDNFSILAEWRATLLRVMSFREVLLTFESRLEAENKIEYRKDDAGTLELDNVGVAGRGREAMLDTSKIKVAPGDRVAVLDKTQSDGNPLLCAMVGLWPWGSGTLTLPMDMRVMILKQRPYFPLGSLRASLAYPADLSSVSDRDAAEALERVGLSYLLPSLDRPRRWENELSAAEQTRLGLARLLLHKPQWIVSDGSIDLTEEEELFDIFASILGTELAHAAFVSIARRSRDPLCTRAISLQASGGAAEPARDQGARKS